MPIFTQRLGLNNAKRKIMKKLDFSAVIFLILSSCAGKESNVENEIITDTPEKSLEIITLPKLVVPEKDFNLDLTEKPDHPIFSNLQIDTSQLFGIWTSDIDNPNATFLINKNEYYIADFEGDPVVQYILNRASIYLFFEWGTEINRISQPSEDILIFSNQNGRKSKFYRFKN
jgi:hypothetical protein